MRVWEQIINAAMLGTDKPMPGQSDLPAEVAEVTSLIDTMPGLDIEDRFLQKASVIYNYRQSGFVPLQKQELMLVKADAESQPYCSNQASAVLKVVLEEDNPYLLQLWLGRCAATGKLLTPDALPALLDKALKDIALQSLVIACSGKRGEWLSRLNSQWSYFVEVPDEELWQNGKSNDRVKVLEKIRKTDPARALALLQETWEQENSVSKIDLLRTLKINPGPADLPWLESLQTEKGQKVKDEVTALLKLIPGSSVIRKYEDVLAQAMVLKKEKGLLGLGTKITIQQKLPTNLDESIFKTGVDKLTGIKGGMTDEQFILYQLVSLVPPSFWEKQFEATPPQVVEYFEKYANAMVPALGLAVSRFEADNWVPYFLKQPGFYIDMVNKLSAEEQEKYLLRFFSGDPQDVIHHALRANHEWGTAFTLSALRYMANNPYQYNRAFFKDNIGLINTGVLNQLEGIACKETNLAGTWEKNRNYLHKLLNLKQQIRQVFNN
jgi:hypothetical protein